MSPEQKPLVSSVAYSGAEAWLSRHPGGMDDIAGLYFRAWSPYGLCPDEAAARHKIEQFHPDNLWLAVSPEGKAIGALHSVQLLVRSVDELFDAVPTYAHAERLAQDQPPGRVNVQVCFSLAVPERYRIRGSDGGVRTVAEGLLATIPRAPGVRTIAYSKATGVASPGSFIHHIVSGFRDSWKLGPGGFHELIGGIIVAGIEKSRQDDKGGGGGNVLVARPNTSREREAFSLLKEKRQQIPPNMRAVASRETSSCMWVFEDTETAIGLFSPSVN